VNKSRSLVVETVQTVRLLVDKVAIIISSIHYGAQKKNLLVLRNELPSYVIWLDFGRSSRRSWGIDHSRGGKDTVRVTVGG
jgi:hypothetical protein